MIFTASQRAQVAAEAERIGLKNFPYTYGGASDHKGYDCSGVALKSWTEVGLTLPHNAADQAVFLKAIPVSNAAWAKILPGDLVFYYETDPTKVPHVAVFVENYSDMHIVAQATNLEYGSEVIRANKYVPVTLLGFVGHN